MARGFQGYNSQIYLFFNLLSALKLPPVVFGQTTHYKAGLKIVLRNDSLQGSVFVRALLDIVCIGRAVMHSLLFEIYLNQLCV